MIKLEDVSFTYNSGERTAGIFDINLNIKAGEVILLCGESGCGKTTLTRLINGLIPNFYEGKLQGSVSVGGKNVSSTPLYKISANVGSVFQNPRSQFFNVDTTSEITFACENLGLPKEEILRRLDDTVKTMQLENLMNRSIFGLSGGEKQKIACASVSALHADVIVMDEPSSNLDAGVTEQLRQTIMRWKSEGKTIIISEHRLYYLKDLADRVIFMKEGRIAKEYSYSEFSGLSASERKHIGLRPFDLAELFENCPDTQACRCGENINISGLCFGYKKEKNVLNIQNINCPVGSVVAVIGENGAGKSTFARCLCGLEKKCGGLMEIAGKQMNNKQRLQNCYMVMQDVNHQLFTESVLDEVLLSMKAEDSAAAEKILEGLNLLQYKGLHPMALSGGQKQRVAIASAVASHREVILFDEPTSGLDLKHMKDVADNITALKNAGKTIFIITHDPEFILSCCTQVLEMQNGCATAQYILDEAGTAKMLEQFLNPQKQLLKQVN